MPNYAWMITALLVLPVGDALAASESASPPATPKDCIADAGSGFALERGKPTFTMTFQNDCARRISCEINAYVVGSRGPTQGHTILRFQPKGQTPAPLHYALRVKELGGTAQYSRDCKFD